MEPLGTIFAEFPFIYLSGRQRREKKVEKHTCLLHIVYRIEVHARLLILSKKSTLHGLILGCTFIDFKKTVPLARLFPPACILIFQKKIPLHILSCTLFFLLNFPTCTFIWACTFIRYTRPCKGVLAQ